jgi:hypothetical protein
MLMRVHLQVLQGDPAQPDASVDSMTTITDMYTLWALPAKMDLVEDFGLSESDASALAGMGIDPKNFDPASLAGLDIAALLKEYPELERLLAMYGIDPSMLATLDPETIRKGLEAYMASGGTIPNLPAGGGTGGGGNGGANHNGGDSGGNDTNNGNDNNNNNENGGSFDMSEVVKMLSSGDKAGAEAYIRAHENELNNKRGGGTSGGGNSGGNTGNAGGSGRGGGSGSGNSGNAGGGSGNTGGRRGGSGSNTGTTGGNRGSRGGRR